MLLISCPWCGPRDEIEFGCGGEAHITRPEQPEELSDEAWADYLFNRANPKGPFAERWVHSHGCRRWFTVVRDTVTNEILAVYKIGALRPDIGSVAAPALSNQWISAADGEGT